MRAGARAGKSHRAGAHRLLHRLHHARDVVLGRRFAQRPLAHHVHAQRRMADIGAVIQRLRQLLDRGQVFRERLPLPVDAGQHRLQRNVLHRGQATREPLAFGWRTGRQREAAVAHDHGGDAMPAGACALAIPVHLRVHVRVAIDEAGRHDQAVRVDAALRRRPNAADLDDAPIRNADIGAVATHARAIDDGAVANDEIQHGRSS